MPNVVFGARVPPSGILDFAGQPKVLVYFKCEVLGGPMSSRCEWVVKGGEIRRSLVRGGADVEESPYLHQGVTSLEQTVPGYCCGSPRGGTKRCRANSTNDYIALGVMPSAARAEISEVITTRRKFLPASARNWLSSLALLRIYSRWTNRLLKERGPEVLVADARKSEIPEGG